MVRAFPELRVVLMSATVDTTLFTDYFGNAKVVEVYGRTYPVQGELGIKIFFSTIVNKPSFTEVNLYECTFLDKVVQIINISIVFGRIA